MSMNNNNIIRSSINTFEGQSYQFAAETINIWITVPLILGIILVGYSAFIIDLIIMNTI